MSYHSTNSEDSKFITKGRTAVRYHRDDRTITRWVEDPEMDFPQPIKIRNRWYFEKAKLDEFDRRLAMARLHDLARRHQAKAAVQCTQSAGGVS